MALISKASLLMVPSTYEPGTLYNVLPSGNRAPDSTDQNSGYDQTRADFDFDRGSNAAATRIGSDGLLKKYRENLLTESNNFSDSDWTLRAGASVTGGQSGYDGTNNAWLLNADTTGTFRFINQATNVNTILTNSIYAKAGSANYIGVTDTAGSSSHIVYFNLSNGTIDSVTGGSLIVDYKIESVGNGWYRCSAALTAHASGTILWFISSTGGSVGSAGDNIYIQNAQSESSLVATDYLNSTSVTGKAGVLVDLPRINYDANGENGALLLEPSRQQLIQYSEYFGGSYWTNTNSSVINNSIVSADGFSNGIKLLDNAVNSYHLIESSAVSATIGSEYTLSVFAKAGEKSILQICFDNNDVTGNPRANFDLQNGVKGSVSSGITASIEDYGNGWYRCSAKATSAVTSLIGIFAIIDATTATRIQTYLGNGTDGLYLFGAQCEAGSYATSYIPNHGESGGVTRAADSCSVTGASDVIGQTEGTFFIDYVSTGLGNDTELFSLSDGTTSNRMYLGETSGFFIALGINGGVVQFSISGSTPVIGQRYKLALGYANNDFVFYLNGTQIGSDSSGSVTATSQVRNDSGAGSSKAYQNVNQLLLFKTRLTNAELATLTTL